MLPEKYRLNYLSTLKSIKNELQRFGSKKAFAFVREVLANIFFESGDIDQFDSNEYCLVLSEHIANSAFIFDFSLFTDDKFDHLFSRFS